MSGQGSRWTRPLPAYWTRPTQNRLDIWRGRGEIQSVAEGGKVSIKGAGGCTSDEEAGASMTGNKHAEMLATIPSSVEHRHLGFIQPTLRSNIMA